MNEINQKKIKTLIKSLRDSSSDNEVLHERKIRDWYISKARERNPSSTHYVEENGRIYKETSNSAKFSEKETLLLDEQKEKRRYFYANQLNDYEELYKLQNSSNLDDDLKIKIGQIQKKHLEEKKKLHTLLNQQCIDSDFWTFDYSILHNELPYESKVNRLSKIGAYIVIVAMLLSWYFKVPSILGIDLSYLAIVIGLILIIAPVAGKQMQTLSIVSALLILFLFNPSGCDLTSVSWQRWFFAILVLAIGIMIKKIAYKKNY